MGPGRSLCDAKLVMFMCVFNYYRMILFLKFYILNFYGSLFLIFILWNLITCSLCSGHNAIRLILFYISETQFESERSLKMFAIASKFFWNEVCGRDYTCFLLVFMSHNFNLYFIMFEKFGWCILWYWTFTDIHLFLPKGL